MLEILSPEWRYRPDEAGDINNILHVKELRKLGVSKDGSCTPQAAPIRVRLPRTCVFADLGHHFLKADLWCFGPAFKGRRRVYNQPPNKEGFRLTHLRPNKLIMCAHNLARFVEEEDEYMYAELRCSFTRGARVFCRKNHVALRLSVLVKNEIGMLELQSIPWIRTSRLSISEKAMCPRECDRKRKAVSQGSPNPAYLPLQKASKQAKVRPIKTIPNVISTSDNRATNGPTRSLVNLPSTLSPSLSPAPKWLLPILCQSLRSPLTEVSSVGPNACRGLEYQKYLIRHAVATFVYSALQREIECSILLSSLSASTARTAG